VLDGKAPDSLLDSYSERTRLCRRREPAQFDAFDRLHHAQEQNLADFRNAVLNLAREHAFARALVNSGRLSVPAFLTDSSLNTPDSGKFGGAWCPVRRWTTRQCVKRRR
jgi:3-(3-hydroxy-phenyl)propionate hydroxylase